MHPVILFSTDLISLIYTFCHYFLAGLLDYAVDVCKKEVTFRGLVDLKRKGSGKEFGNKLKSKNVKQILALCGLRI